MKVADVTFPLHPKESAALYSRLASMGGRVFAVHSSRCWMDLSDEELLAVAAEQSRFDFRLLYVLVSLLAERFHSFHPFRLRDAVASMKFPAVWGVILEFAAKLSLDCDLGFFSKIVLRNVQPAPAQMFYNTMRAPVPNTMLGVVRRTPDEFLKWGFFCAELPFLKELTLVEKSKTFGVKTRRKILESLFAEREPIRLSDYLVAIDHAVSRQQAHRDLIRFPGVRTISDRRGRRYSAPSNFRPTVSFARS